MSKYGGLKVQEGGSRFGGQAIGATQEAEADSLAENTLDVAGEFSAGANDAVMTFADTAVGALNAIQGGLRGLGTLAVGGGLDEAVRQTQSAPITKPSDAIEDATGFRPGEGGFMEPGLARDAVRMTGQAVPMAAAAVPVAGRNVATLPGAAAEFAGAGSAAPTASLPAVADISDKVARDMALKNQTGDAIAAGFKLDDAGSVVRDKVQRKALKTGVEDSTVAYLSAAPKSSKRKMLEMLDAVDAGQTNKLKKAANRPADVVGDSLVERVNVLIDKNKEAGRELRKIVDGLGDQRAEFETPFRDFLEALKEKGVIGDPATGALDFSQSTMRGKSKGNNKARKLIKDAVDYALDTRANPTAKDLHQMKKFLDDLVTWGEGKSGAEGTAEALLKTFRRGIDQSLDSTFPEYDRANQVYAMTIEPIQEVMRLAGKNFNIDSPNAKKALGILSRRAISNAQSKTAVEDMLSAVDDVARKFDPTMEEGDMLRQVVFASDLDSMFGTGALNSFQGQEEAAMRAIDAGRRGFKEAAEDFVADKAKKMLSKEDKDKIKAMRELLSQ